MDMNRCIVHGRLTVHPQLHYTKQGIAVVRFPIACERPFTGKNGEKQVDFLPIIAWRSYGERIANNLEKGQECAITGRLQSRVRADIKINTYEILAQDVIFGQTQRGLSKDINHIFFTGRLTVDPELHYVGTDAIAVCQFTVAVERDYTSKENNEAVNDYLSVLAWRSYAERLANDLRQGMAIAVIGRIQARQHHQHQTTIHEVHAEQVKYG
ncbi:single-stranded DNA-binding protein [Bacillus piscicola]|uniref:single-stranded DNA-binding protein n=1 Tax=Bacillus piscicola TaxID=1632684 RepID=UPI001F08C004|nr:single-stranded DNA-binding protein [Bacillus piscicola]